MADLQDRHALEELFAKHPVDAVIHMAAVSVVSDSVRQPLKYYLQNVGGLTNLLLAMRGAGDRLAATLTTTLATALFFLPLIFAGEQAGTEILRPMAIVVVGGLVTSTLLNLFVLPALYLRFGSSPQPEQPPVMVEEGALA